MRWLPDLRGWAHGLGRDILALYIAARDRRTPLSARLVAGATAAYALSPIDLIPDFIPLLGLLDDLLIVPAGIWLAIRLIPAGLLAEYRDAATQLVARPRSRSGMIAVFAIWLTAAAMLGLMLRR